MAVCWMYISSFSCPFSLITIPWGSIFRLSLPPIFLMIFVSGRRQRRISFPISAATSSTLSLDHYQSIPHRKIADKSVPFRGSEVHRYVRSNSWCPPFLEFPKSHTKASPKLLSSRWFDYGFCEPVYLSSVERQSASNSPLNIQLRPASFCCNVIDESKS